MHHPSNRAERRAQKRSIKNKIDLKIDDQKIRDKDMIGVYIYGKPFKGLTDSQYKRQYYRNENKQRLKLKGHKSCNLMYWKEGSLPHYLNRIRLAEIIEAELQEYKDWLNGNDYL